ncbi:MULTISPECIES: VOC family protein [unclassified Pseudomonas]|uniref:VOC family protein n=1 Tax=unclassified Pseudomonas TaxID=196821 RepID=UPI000C2F9AA5|nr:MULTISPECIES: VOC family protein [unclassified Pseudomonas]MCU1738006.1 VOC family protein [Pseudomonas sp. 20S_6.2_Bac1]
MTAVAQFPQGIDHPLVTVRDHAVALEQYRKMGFSPSPVSYHPWGSVTSLMMFPSNFIELIGVDDPSKFGTNSVNGFCFGRQLGQFLDRGEEGVSLVALHSKNADDDHARLVESGLASQGRIDFRRRMMLPDGRHDEAVVSLALFIDPALPDASNFICHQHRPELIWVKGWQHHPNGANGILAVTYLADPAAMEARWRAIYGDAVRYEGDVLEADTRCGVLRAMDAATAAGEYPGIELPQIVEERPHAIAIKLNTTSLCDVRSILAHNAVPHVQVPGRVMVAPRAAGNVILEFVQTI